MEFDDNGWAVIHHMVAADKPLLNQVRIFCEADKTLLSLQTRDQYSYPPLLLACHHGKADSVNCLLELGADISQRDASGYSPLLIAALKENANCVRALLDFDKGQWRELIGLIAKGKNDEVEMIADQMRILISDPLGPREKLCSLFVEGNDGLEAIKTSLSDAKVSNEKVISLIDLLIAIIDGRENYQLRFSEVGCIGVVADILKTTTSIEVLGYGFDCLTILSRTNPEWAFQMFQNGLTDSIIGALIRSDSVTLPLLYSAINLLDQMLRSNDAVPESVGAEDNIFELLADCFDIINPEEPEDGINLTDSLLDVFIALLDNKINQERLSVVPNLISGLLTLAMASSYRQLQLKAIQSVVLLAKNNRGCSAYLIDAGAAKALQTVLDQTKSALDVKAATLNALWMISGGQIAEQKAIASLIGEELLISILQDTPLSSNNDTHILHQIACEALGVLCRGPKSCQKSVLESGAAKVYLTILRSKNVNVVIEVLRSMSLLCVGTSLIPDSLAQRTLAVSAMGSSSTIRILLNILLHSSSAMASVAAAYTIASLILGNEKLQAELESDPDWSFVHVVKFYYSDDETVRLHAAAALAVFCFNSQYNLDTIERGVGRLTKESMDRITESESLEKRYDAAFDQIVLSNLVAGCDPAYVCADGMQILVKALQRLKHALDDYDIELVAAATGHVSALLRLRSSGVAKGFITVGICEYLCDIMEHKEMSEAGRDAAACGLSTLTHIPSACRLILKVFRTRPFVVHMMLQYVSIKKTSYEFRTRWKKMKTMHLPELTLDQKEFLVKVKAYDRRIALTEASVTWNLSLMSSFARHLRTPSSKATRNASAQSSARLRSAKSSRISMKSASETKSMAVISEHGDGATIRVG